jgi:hypothetical protein
VAGREIGGMMKKYKGRLTLVFNFESDYRNKKKMEKKMREVINVYTSQVNGVDGRIQFEEKKAKDKIEIIEKGGA